MYICLFISVYIYTCIYTYSYIHTYNQYMLMYTFLYMYIYGGRRTCLERILGLPRTTQPYLARVSATFSLLGSDRNLPPEKHNGSGTWNGMWARCRTQPSIHIYRGTSLIRNSNPLGPYSSNMPRALWWSQGAGAVSYQRGTPVHPIRPGPPPIAEREIFSLTTYWSESTASTR